MLNHTDNFSRRQQVANLRYAAITILLKHSKPSLMEEWRGFMPRLSKAPHPTLSVKYSKILQTGHHQLDVWLPRGKVLNIAWCGGGLADSREQIEIVSFKRGEWELDLLAMERAFRLA